MALIKACGFSDLSERCVISNAENETMNKIKLPMITTVLSIPLFPNTPFLSRNKNKKLEATQKYVIDCLKIDLLFILIISAGFFEKFIKDC